MGTLLTGVLASPAINPAGRGLIAGNAAQLGTQLLGILAAAALAGVGTFVLLKLVGLVLPLRLGERQETHGVDLAEHQEEGYQEAERPLAAPVFVGGD